MTAELKQIQKIILLTDAVFLVSCKAMRVEHFDFFYFNVMSSFYSMLKNVNIHILLCGTQRLIQQVYLQNKY